MIQNHEEINNKVEIIKTEIKKFLDYILDKKCFGQVIRKGIVFR